MTLPRLTPIQPQPQPQSASPKMGLVSPSLLGAGLLSQSFRSKLASFQPVAGTTSFQIKGIPPGFHTLVCEWFFGVQGATPASLRLQFNNDSAADYTDNAQDFSNAANLNEDLAATTTLVGNVGAVGTLGGGAGVIKIFGYAQTSLRQLVLYDNWHTEGNAAGNTHRRQGGAIWFPASVQIITELDLSLTASTFAGGGYFDVYGDP